MNDTPAKSAAESRIFVKFEADGSFGGAYIEGANLNIKYIPVYAPLEEGQEEPIVVNQNEVFDPELGPEYEEVTYEQYQMLVGNVGDGPYIRDPETGEYIPKPPHVPTAEEKLAALDAEYAAKISEVNNAILIAAAEGDTELQTELVAEKAALKAEYEQKRGEL